MKMKRENKIKLFSTIVVVLIVLTLIFNRALLKIKYFLDRSFLPLQSKVYNSTEKVKEMLSTFSSFKTIMEENEKLKKENMELKVLGTYNRELMEENIRLTSLLGLKAMYSNMENVRFARVIFKDIYNINSKFYIDLGDKDNIKKNMIVIYEDSLIGRIVEVHKEYSVVEMITSSSTRISVKTGSDLLGITQGSDDNGGVMYFQPSTFEEDLKQGEEVFTSGISEIYPAGLKVGKIAEINKAENNLFKSIKIRPNFDSKNLKEVMIYKYEDILKKEGN